MYDPLLFAAKSFDPKQTAFSKPNPEMAQCWYQVAHNLGEKRGKPRLDALIASNKYINALGKMSSSCIKVLQKYGSKNPGL
jgi:hypothetical protein